jgi:hypothetical protein
MRYVGLLAQETRGKFALPGKVGAHKKSPQKKSPRRKKNPNRKG